MLTPQELVALKEQIKSEMARRCAVGSLKEYADAQYDFEEPPRSGGIILTEHGEKTINLLNRIKEDPNTPNAVYGERIPPGFDRGLFERVTRYKAEPMDTVQSSCNAACSGLCSTTCSGSCRTTCSGSCTGTCISCSNGCNNNCSGSCNTSCYGSCYGTCSSCSNGCNSNCTGSCTGQCFSCGGQCSDGCTTRCSMGACTGSCSAASGTSCGGACMNTCVSTSCYNGCRSSG